MWGPLLGGVAIVPGDKLPLPNESLTNWFNGACDNAWANDAVYDVGVGGGADVVLTLDLPPVAGLGQSLVLGQSGIGWGGDFAPGGAGVSPWMLRVNGTGNNDQMRLESVWLGDTFTADSANVWLSEHYLDDFYDCHAISLVWYLNGWKMAEGLVFFGDGVVDVFVRVLPFEDGGPERLPVSVQISGPNGQGVGVFDLLPDYVTGYAIV
jgi:hypothetical protein